MKLRRFIWFAVFIIAVLALLVSAWNLYSYWHENRISKQVTAALTEHIAKVEPQWVPAEASDGAPESKVEAETVPISADFTALLAENSDIAAWLYCEDTPINYPVVHSADNEDYLYHLTDGTYNANGTLFIDFRNQGDFSDWNTVIYGHNMRSGAMFGSLTQYKKQEYYDEHPVLYLLTPTADYKLLPIAGCVTDADVPLSTDERDAFLDMVTENSTFSSSAEVTADDRLVTLSTCSYEYNNARYILVAVLRELE